MRTNFILTLLCFCSLVALSQKLELEEASPFSAVKWENEEPIVQFENEWYHFEKLDNFTKQEILNFCKNQFGHKWQKRFSEDLVEVLLGLDYRPDINVKLLLSKKGITSVYKGTFTLENRQSSLEYNRSQVASTSKRGVPQKISITEALTDLRQFEEILNMNSSYAQLSSFDYRSAIRELSLSIENAANDVDTNSLTNDIGKIMAEIGDRHSSVTTDAFKKITDKNFDLRLPFGLAVIDGKIVALKQNSIDQNYIYFFDSHHYIKNINGVSTDTLINSYNYRAKKAPAQAKFSRGVAAIQKYGELLFKNNIECPDTVEVIFSDGTTEKVEHFQLTTDRKGYFSKLLQEHYDNLTKAEDGSFNGLIKTLEKNIGYINIPMMYHYDEAEGLEDFIKDALNGFSDTKALIIDVRNNPGGGREILQTFASYILKPEQSPWIANVAYLRTDSTMIGDSASMNARYLHSYSSNRLTDTDRNAIDKFNFHFKLQKSFDTFKFSGPFYMVLKGGQKSYMQPIYILVNERSFSAATVFTSAFAGLPNVKIVGVTTDGSSGNSIILYLKNSKIRVRVSTMLSFQRNGATLDGNGTIPDITIPANETQVLNGVDNQLNQLIEIINSND